MVSSCGRSVPGYQASDPSGAAPVKPRHAIPPSSVPGAARGYARESGAANPSTSPSDSPDGQSMRFRFPCGWWVLPSRTGWGVTARLCPRPPRAAHPVPVGGIDEAVDVCSLLVGVAEPTPFTCPQRCVVPGGSAVGDLESVFDSGKFAT